MSSSKPFQRASERLKCKRVKTDSSRLYILGDGLADSFPAAVRPSATRSRDVMRGLYPRLK